MSKYPVISQNTKELNKNLDKWKAQIEREARISELKRMWDENTNLCVLDKDDTVATLTLKLGKTNQIIAKRIKELESE